MSSDAALTPVLLDTEEFWDDLLLYVRRKRVIPVIGAELLTFDDGGGPVSLYGTIADRLLKKYGISTPLLTDERALRPGHELNDAVCILAANGHRIKDLYGRIADILDSVLAENKGIPEPLRQIASIRDFDLFVTTTPDNLLTQAINAVRFSGADVTHEIEYAPNLPLDPEKKYDIPEIRNPQYNAVFYLFGKAAVGPYYAIHDEDALEFPYMLREKGPERMFSALKTQNLLLIGCTFYDWLSRFFIRLSNSARLSADRPKKEFLVGKETAGDRGLTGFLKRFSQDSRCYPGQARSFVDELYGRWASLANRVSPSVPAKPGVPLPEPLTGTVFISYAHEDIAAARTLFDELQKIGGDVAWFDKTDLKPGDEWDQEICRAIEQCHLFLPLLSAITEQRTEGYFIREWKRAAERYEGIKARKFILPIVVDPDYAGDMTRYRSGLEFFQKFQYHHAPGGRVDDVLRNEITQQLRTVRRSSA